MKKAKGITLISLIIMIIVLIILAGVAINFAMGENGIITRTRNAKQQYTQEEIKEKLNLKIADIQIEKQGNANLSDLDGLNLEGYAVSAGSIGRMLTVTKGSETYIFWVDSNLNITEFDGNISIENNNSNNNTTIQEFTPTISNINGTYFTIEANATSSESTVLAYEFFVNGEYKGLTLANSANTMDITGLELDTEYEVYVVALDDKGTIRKSTVIQQKTLDQLYLYKDGQEYIKYTIALQEFSMFAQKNATLNIVKNENSITINTYCNSGYYCYRGIGKEIELNGEYAKLCVNIVNADLGARFSIGDYDYSGGTYIKEVKNLEIDSKSEKTYVLDITGITGNKIVGIQAYSADTTNITFNKMWLEK